MSTTVNMKDVLTSLFDSIDKSKKEEMKSDYGDFINEILKSHSDKMKDMEYFDLFINYEVDNFLEICLQAIYPNMNKERFHKLFFAHRHYSFLENNLQELIKSREGFACCADKSRWLMEAYKQQLVDDTIPDMTREEKCYWKPRFGTAEQWINLCNSLGRLYYGQSKDYLEAMMALSKI